jgi:hypothetical protein
MRRVAARCVPAQRRFARAPLAPAICGVTRQIFTSSATRVLFNTVSTMYAEGVKFFSTSAAGSAGFRGAAVGIERFELTSEQSDITAALKRHVGTAAAACAGEDNTSLHQASTL